jgi:hypothetical protein
MLAMLLIAGMAHAADRIERIQLAAGLTSATINGRIKGEEAVGYTMGATEGQTMSVAFRPENPDCHFNVLPPGSEAALHDGTNAGNDFSITLPLSGDYVTRVYLIQSAAQRGDVCDYKITLEIKG